MVFTARSRDLKDGKDHINVKSNINLKCLLPPLNSLHGTPHLSAFPCLLTSSEIPDPSSFLHVWDLGPQSRLSRRLELSSPIPGHFPMTVEGWRHPALLLAYSRRPRHPSPTSQPGDQELPEDRRAHTCPCLCSGEIMSSSERLTWPPSQSLPCTPSLFPGCGSGVFSSLQY